MSTRIITGDCRTILPTLPAKSVHCCVTSPPYFGLRDYGTAQWDGGDPECNHKQGRNGAGRADGIVDERGQRNRDGVGSMGGDCGKCGAVRIDQQIGLEASLDAYLTTLVAVFREVRRVLRDDGSLWLNMGDSYAGGAGGRGDSGNLIDGKPTSIKHDGTRIQRALGSLKPKDLMLVPARLALALQADGWYLRSDIIWAKPNPMPESVTDRPTSSHEHVFLLTKKSRYFWDAEAVREPNAINPDWDYAKPKHVRLTDQDEFKADGRDNKIRKGGNGGWTTFTPIGEDGLPTGGRNLRNVWTIATQPYAAAHFATFPPALVEPCIKAGTSEKGCCPACGAPWTRVVEQTGRVLPTTPGTSVHTQDTHKTNGDFRLAQKAGAGSGRLSFGRNETVEVGWQPSCHCDAGGRPQTRRAWELFEQHGLTEKHLDAIRAVGITDVGKAQVTQTGYGKNTPEMQRLAAEAKAVLGGYYRELLTAANSGATSWQESCQCSVGAPIPCTVLDPFMGAGTSLLVADRLGRNGIGIELNEQYAALARNRIVGDAPLFAEVTTS